MEVHLLLRAWMFVPVATTLLCRAIVRAAAEIGKEK